MTLYARTYYAFISNSGCKNLSNVLFMRSIFSQYIVLFVYMYLSGEGNVTVILLLRLIHGAVCTFVNVYKYVSTTGQTHPVIP